MFIPTILLSIFCATSCYPFLDQMENDEDELLPPFPMDKRDIEHEVYVGPLDSASLLLSLPRTDRKMSNIDFLRRLKAASNQ